jgi:hypothetical protein
VPRQADGGGIFQKSIRYADVYPHPDAAPLPRATSGLPERGEPTGAGVAHWAAGGVTQADLRRRGRRGNPSGLWTLD